MKTLKNLLIICLIFLIPFSFLYLCVSFTCADFNFANWQASTRGTMTFFASLASLMSLALYLPARPHLRIVK